MRVSASVGRQFNAFSFLKTYSEVWAGDEISPRGTKCLESADHRLVLSMQHSPITSFKARKLSLKYAKEEFLWYLRADPFDQSIEQHASMWQKIRQPDGSYFSNYGQYLFPKQFGWVVQELARDQWSRRASMVLLKPEHLFAENKDVVCTYAINFSIRHTSLSNRSLHMRVHMRSNDVIFGMTNDVFCFSMLYRMVFAELSASYPDLLPGLYTHLVDSMHVYDRHYIMIQKIIGEGIDGYEYIDMPWPNSWEVIGAVAEGKPNTVTEWGRWLNAA